MTSIAHVDRRLAPQSGRSGNRRPALTESERALFLGSFVTNVIMVAFPGKFLFYIAPPVLLAMSIVVGQFIDFWRFMRIFAGFLALSIVAMLYDAAEGMHVNWAGLTIGMITYFQMFLVWSIRKDFRVSEAFAYRLAHVCLVFIYSRGLHRRPPVRNQRGWRLRQRDLRPVRRQHRRQNHLPGQLLLRHVLRRGLLLLLGAATPHIDGLRRCPDGRGRRHDRSSDHLLHGDAAGPRGHRRQPPCPPPGCCRCRRPDGGIYPDDLSEGGDQRRELGLQGSAFGTIAQEDVGRRRVRHHVERQEYRPRHRHRPIS